MVISGPGNIYIVANNTLGGKGQIPRRVAKGAAHIPYEGPGLTFVREAATLTAGIWIFLPGAAPMKALKALGLFLLAGLIVTGPAAYAERVMYVSDRMQITVRVEPTGDARVLETISSGDAVSVLEENNEGWTKVHTNSGKDGWVLKRHLIEDKPAMVRLKEMAPHDKSVSQRMEDLTRQLTEAKKAQSLAEGRSQEAEARLLKLQGDCAEVIKLRDDHNRVLEDCQQKAVALEEMTTENESLRFGTNIKWFLSGGGILLVGWILGAVLSRRKRRWSSTLD